MSENESSAPASGSSSPSVREASPQSPATSPQGTGETPLPSSGLPPTIAAAIAELLPLVGGIIFFMMDRKHRLVRFHAMQSIYFGAAMLILSVVFTVLMFLPVLGWLFNVLVAPIASVLLFVVWVIAVFKAFNGVEWEIPLIGKLVKQQLNEPQA